MRQTHRDKLCLLHRGPVTEALPPAYLSPASKEGDWTQPAEFWQKTCTRKAWCGTLGLVKHVSFTHVAETAILLYQVYTTYICPHWSVYMCHHQLSYLNKQNQNKWKKENCRTTANLSQISGWYQWANNYFHTMADDNKRLILELHSIKMDIHWDLLKIT